MLSIPGPREKSQNENGDDKRRVSDGNYQSVRTVTVLGWLHQDGVAGRFVEHNLSQNFGVSLFGVFQRFQNHDTRALSRYERFVPVRGFFYPVGHDSLGISSAILDR